MFSWNKNVQILTVFCALLVSFFIGKNFSDKKLATKAAPERAIASTFEVDESLDIPADMRDFQSKLFALKSKEDLDTLLVNLEANYDNHSPALKLITLNLSVLPLFKSFTYSVEKIVSSQKMVRTRTVSMMKNLSKTLAVNTSLKQWNVGFDYLSVPFVSNNKLPHQFKDEVEMQSYMCSAVYDKVKSNSLRLSKLASEIKRPIVFDKRVAFGKDTFKDDLSRFTVLNKPELMMMRSGLESALFDLAFSCAYSIDGVTKVAKNVGMLYGMDMMKLFSQPDGVSNKNKVLAMRAVPQFLKLKADGEQWTKKSWDHGKEAQVLLESAWESMDKYPETQNNAFKRDYIDTHGEDIQTAIDKSKRFFSDSMTSIRSGSTGNIIKVNIKKFFDHPEKDLKDLLPTGWVEGDDNISGVIQSTGESYTYKNYRIGSPVKWKDEVFSKYVQSDDRVKGDVFLEAFRTANSSRDGELLSMVFKNGLL